jgi:hypothetical protein
MEDVSGEDEPGDCYREDAVGKLRKVGRQRRPDGPRRSRPAVRVQRDLAWHFA